MKTIMGPGQKRTLRRLAVGLAVGGVSLVMDEFLVLLTIGHVIPLFPSFVMTYLISGVAIGLVCGYFFRKTMDIFTCGLALLYIPPVLERLCTFMGPRLPWPLLGLVLILASGVYLMWIMLLRRVAPPEHRWLSGLVTALGTATVLAVNRNLVSSPVQPSAVAVDLSILGLMVAIVMAGRRFGVKRLAVIAVLAAVVCLGSVTGFRWLALSAVERPDGQSPPNLLLVVVDTLRRDVFHELMETSEEGQEFLDSLEGAVWFDDAVAVAPWTIPSMGSIMTGLYPPEHGFGPNRGGNPKRPIRQLAPEALTVAEFLNDQGYATAALVANPILYKGSGIARGFEHYEVFAGGTVKLPLLTAVAGLGFLDHEYYQWAPVIRRSFVRQLPRLFPADRPGFVWLHLMEPHSPLHEHDELPDEPKIRGLPKIERLYRNEVRFVLNELTIIMQKLKESGKWQNTALIVVSDHGEMFPSDRHRVEVEGKLKIYGHGHAMYGELLRVPLLIRPAGGIRTRRVSRLVSQVDLLPTIGDLLGLEMASMPDDQFSLASFLNIPGTGDQGRTQVISCGNKDGPRQRAFRVSGMKLIHYPDGDVNDELYDIVRDPGELENVAHKKPDQLRLLKGLLESQWSELHPLSQTVAEELDSDLRKRLKALGYVE